MDLLSESCFSGTVDIGPCKAVPLAGRTDRLSAFDGVDAPLEANFLLVAVVSPKQVIQRGVLLVSLDVLFASTELEHAIRAELQDSVSIGDEFHVVLVASHTHTAPSLDPRKPGLGECDSEHLASVAQRIGAAVVKATQSSGADDVSVSIGRAHCDAAVHRRKRGISVQSTWPFLRRAVRMAPNPDKEIPDTLTCLVVRNRLDEVMAIVWSWPCHAVTHAASLRVSPDFVGDARIDFRRALGAELPVLYLPGFSGDIRPDFASLRFSLKNLFLANLYRFVSPDSQQLNGFRERLAEAVRSALTAGLEAEPEAISASDANVTASVASSQLRLVDIAHAVSAVVDRSGNGAEEISLLTFALGPYRFLLVGAEVCSDFSQTIGEDDYSVLSGCYGEVPCYLPTASMVKEGGYEVTGFRTAFGFQWQFKENVETELLRCLRGLSANRQDCRV